jgi:UDP-N-acetylmuramate--alanine ligase
MKPLKEYRHIYFLGIGGIGMSALARCCQLWDIQVSGYDRQSSAITDSLSLHGATIQFADDPDQIPGEPDLVIYTPAIPKDNKVRLHFLERGTPMVKRSEALEVVTKGIDTIAVAGTHGKTTTSSMVSVLMSECGIEHTAILGGLAVNYQSNFHSTSQALMVVEADEYDRSFHRLHPKWAVVTAMDPDHLDIYGSHELMIEGYRQFIRQVQPDGLLLYREGLAGMIGEEVMNELRGKKVHVLSYGVGEGDYAAVNLQVEKGIWHFDLKTPNGLISGLELRMPGQHNVQNATAACAMVLALGGKEEELRKAMPRYKGVVRRFEIRYQDADHVLVDDYAHHPEELRAAIRAAKETYKQPVTGVFQPHLYTRTRDLATEFAEALDELDTPVIIDLYPAREEPIPGVSSRLIYDHMRNPNKQYFNERDWVPWIIQQRPPVLITIGAGDLDKHIPELIRQLYSNEETE